MPSHIPADVRRRLEPVRLVVLDVDGVLTDGVLLYGPSGEALKRFTVRDGLAMRLLRRAGIEVGVISGRSSDAVRRRCLDLGLREELIVQGSRGKGEHLDRLEALVGVADHEVAAVGDDLPDLPLLLRVGLAACPADAAAEVAAVCHLVCRSEGGRGVVREVAELILKAQRRWQEQVARWTTPPPGVEEREEP